MEKKVFQKTILDYYHTYGRHSLPWRKTKNPYYIFVSECMLQQTQVDRVVPKYKAFIKQFPTWKKLVYAKQSEVLQAWQGLGYNRRALHLKRAGEIIVEKYHGTLPQDISLLDALPGIGVNTAAAICAYAFNMPVVYIETNIRRIYIHFFFKHKKSVHDDAILNLVTETFDRKNPRQWYSALMDYGTYLKGEVENSNRKSKHYTKQSKFAGSDRQLRGKILKLLLEKEKLTEIEVSTSMKEKKERIQKVFQTLFDDGFLVRKGAIFSLKK